MPTEVGTYTVEDAFRITDRGWALVGVLTGQVLNGNRLLFPSGLELRVVGVDFGSRSGGKQGLMVPPQFANRQEFINQQLIGSTARVLE